MTTPLSTYDWDVFVPLIGAFNLPKPFLLYFNQSKYLILEPKPPFDAFLVLVLPALSDAEF